MDLANKKILEKAATRSVDGNTRDAERLYVVRFSGFRLYRSDYPIEYANGRSPAGTAIFCKDTRAKPFYYL